MIFAEALTTLDEYRQFVQVVRVPVLANITEFGKTPLFDVNELASVGVDLVLYPLSAFRAMSRAAEGVYASIRKNGTQRSVVQYMQTALNCTTFWDITNTNKSSTGCLEKRQINVERPIALNPRGALHRLEVTAALAR